MQLIQPKVKELQKKYGHDRESCAQETMKLYKETGTNPFASCLPLLVQLPIFIALFRLLDLRRRRARPIGVMTEPAHGRLGPQRQRSSARPISTTFRKRRPATSACKILARDPGRRDDGDAPSSPSAS